MFTITDGVVLVLLLYFWITGWRKAFLRSLLGPVSLLLCLYTAWGYFLKTHNIFISVNISFFGPFVINFLGSALIRFIDEADVWGRIQLPGTRWLGAFVNLLWGSVMAGIMVILIALSPSFLFPSAKIQSDVLHSKTFALLSHRLQRYLPPVNVRPVSPAQYAGPAPGGETALPSGAQSLPAQPELIPEAQALLQDERVKALMSDPDVVDLIAEKNYMGLLENPNFRKILEDPQLIMKFMDVQKKMGGQMVLPGPVENASRNEQP